MRADIRHGNTGRELVNSGAWVKVGRKHYRHIDGAEVRYNCNHWGWQIVGQPELWKSLWVAAHWATRDTHA